MRYAASALFVCGLLTGAGGATARPADPIGEAVYVVNLVTAELQRDTRSLRSGDLVRQDETIEVGYDATSELVLNDDTKIALGPGSRLVLDKFVYDIDQRTGSILINLAKGTLRFVTGLAEKPAYVIRVPAASITVRGTIFDLFVEESGASWLLLQDGGVHVCTDGGTCRDHNEPGKLIQISAAGIGIPTRWASLPGIERISFDSAFPFVVEAPTIDRKPKFTRDQIVKGIGLAAIPPVTGPKEPAPKPQKASKEREQKSERKQEARDNKKDDDDDEDKSRGSKHERKDKKKKSLFERMRDNDDNGGGRQGRGQKGRRADRD